MQLMCYFYILIFFHNDINKNTITVLYNCILFVFSLVIDSNFNAKHPLAKHSLYHVENIKKTKTVTEVAFCKC